MPRLLLASASPARAATLRAAGIDPLVQVADIDETAVLARARSARPAVDVAEAVQILARAKAEAVVAAGTPPEAEIVIGCDSLLELDGQEMGKPASAAQARERWQRMRGRSGVLRTGHWIWLRDGRTAGAASATTVTFANLSDAEIDAYVATGEPLGVAGGFTLDGLGGPFIERVHGDPHAVVGLSLPLLRRMLAEIDLGVHELWEDTAGDAPHTPASS